MATHGGWLGILLAATALLGCDGSERDTSGSIEGEPEAMSGGRAGTASGGRGGAGGAHSLGGEHDGGGLPEGSGGSSAGAGAASAEDPQGGEAGAGSATDAGAAPAIDESAELYAEDHLPRFDITLPQSSIDMLNADPREYVPGELRYGDEVVSNIGVRIKGEYSLRTLEGKPAFKLKLDEYVPKQELRGLRRLTFNNMMQDFSFIAERLAYLVYRQAGLPAPRCNSALLYVNGEYYGVYANVETEDKTFLRRWFEDDDGNLYEEGQVDFTSSNVGVFELETNEMENDRSDLAHMIEVFEATTPETFMTDMSSVLDVQHFLRFTALEGIVNQWDMYGYTRFGPNNFRIYHDPITDRFVFIPWGMDLALKPLMAEEHIELFGTTETSGLIFVRCLESPACRAAYATAVEEMLEVFEAADLATKADEYFEQIREHIVADTRKEQIMPTVDEAYGIVRENILARPEQVRAELAAEMN